MVMVMVVIKGYGISSRPMNMNVQYKRIKIGKKYEKGATVNHEIYMEAHFLQLDASNVKRLLVRRDEESVKVDQVFSGQFCLVLKKKENDEGVCSF